jgi:hypothetical protein
VWRILQFFRWAMNMLYDCPDAVDGAVEGFLPVEQFTSVDS